MGTTLAVELVIHATQDVINANGQKFAHTVTVPTNLLPDTAVRLIAYRVTLTNAGNVPQEVFCLVEVAKLALQIVEDVQMAFVY